DIIEALEARRADEGPALREPDDVLDLAAPEVRPDLVGHRPETLEREEHIRELHLVRKLDGHHVARSDAERAELCGHPIHAHLELGIGDTATAVHERLARGMLSGPPL